MARPGGHPLHNILLVLIQKFLSWFGQTTELLRNEGKAFLHFLLYFLAQWENS